MTEETIFLAALEKKDPTERLSYLDEVCTGNPVLRKRVEELLQSHDDPDFLDAPANLTPVQIDCMATQDFQRAVKGKRPTQDELALLGPARKPEFLGSLAHYDVMELAGRGGMGVVFKARDAKLQRIVAVKVLSPQLAAHGAARQRFVREAQAAAAIRDQHVVSIHAVDDEGAVPYLVMEFIDGVTLEQQIKAKGPIAVKEILRIGMQAAEGLAAAHRQGLIHRDVKPANILLENGVQRVKITDFGLARAGDNASLTQSGVIAGTPLYMSPEQARGAKVDQRSDLFSLGSVLYTMCTGYTAFAAANTMAVLKRVCDETPRPIGDINRDIPDWLAAIVDKLLAKDPAARYQTAAEVAELLGEHLARLNYSGPVQPAPSAAPKASRRKPIAWAAGAFLCAGLAALLVAFIMTGRTDPEKKAEGVANADASKKDKGDDGADRDKTTPNEGKKLNPPPPDPRVLTVSQKPEDGGRFRTISEALDNVAPGMTICVLDDAVYAEYLNINRPEKYRGLVLEATGKASLQRPPQRYQAVTIRGVPNVTLRGFRFLRPQDNHHYALVFVEGPSPGVVLDGLDMTGTGDGDCVNLYGVAHSGNDAPFLIQNCTMRDACAVHIEGRNREKPDLPLPCGHVVIRNNTFTGGTHFVVLDGAVHKIHVVGNRISSTRFGAIDLQHLLPGSADILLANNTLLRCDSAVRIWDDHEKGKDFLKCKNIRVQNNLIFATDFAGDMIFYNNRRVDLSMRKFSAGDVKALLGSPEWHFSHNWREIDPAKARAQVPDRWIPFSPTDKWQVPIGVPSLKPAEPNFLRPAKDSPLAKAGVNDGVLPAYVGAVPSEGVEPWNWDKTWAALHAAAK